MKGKGSLRSVEFDKLNEDWLYLKSIGAFAINDFKYSNDEEEPLFFKKSI